MGSGGWYVARDGQTFGPFTSDEMAAGILDGQLKRQDPVWRNGMADWAPAADVPGLFTPPALPSLTVPPPTIAVAKPQPAAEEIVRAPSAAERTVPRKSGFIRRHWRGELPLAQSYWIVGFLLTILMILLSHPLGDWLAAPDLPLPVAGVATLLFLSFILVVTVWQLVGIWRAAGNHKGLRAWALLARVAVIIGVLRASTDFVDVVGPMMKESIRIATGRDDTPAFHLRLLRNGTEVELAGGMPIGTAAALKTLLDAAPAVRVLHLNSVGGRVNEGLLIYQLARDRNLITYTATDCVSACTIAFLGGTQRYLSSRARLGFHSSSFGSLDQAVLPAINIDVRRILVANGAPHWFIEKALSTRADSMWYPSGRELIDANIVTRMVEPGYFAPSGLGG